MELVLEPWHWFVLGVLLIISELLLPAFNALWFGIGAIMVGIFVFSISDDGNHHPTHHLDDSLYSLYRRLV